MSFSAEVKDEVTRVECTRAEYLSELSAILRNSAVCNLDGICITIENNAVARRIYKLFKDIYDVSASITVRKRYGFSNHLIYILVIKFRVREILEDLSIWNKNADYLDVPMEYLVSDYEAIRAYLRGVFITCGSINDPKTSRYHLELIVDTGSYADYLSKLLNDHGLNSKVIKRKKNYTVYIKEAEKISDFLRLIKAYHGVMYYEDIRIYRDHKNMTNRLNNCEQANIDKVFMTAYKQIQDIHKLESLDMLDLLDDKLNSVIHYRLKYPEASLQELSDIMTKELGVPITKSGLNHRFRKIREIVGRIEEKEKD